MPLQYCLLLLEKRLLVRPSTGHWRMFTTAAVRSPEKDTKLGIDKGGVSLLPNFDVTAGSASKGSVSLRVRSGARALRAAPVAPRGAHRGASVPVRAIGGKKGASASADGKKAAAKSVGKEKKSSGKTGTAIGESPLSNLSVPLPVAGIMSTRGCGERRREPSPRASFWIPLR